MAYINTGYARNTTLTVTKGTYSEDYDITAGFEQNGTTYPSLSPEGFALLSDDDYERRLADFLDYVYAHEDGLRQDCPDMTVGSVVYDTVLCPLPSPSSSSQEEE